MDEDRKALELFERMVRALEGIEHALQRLEPPRVYPAPVAIKLKLIP